MINVSGQMTAVGTVQLKLPQGPPLEDGTLLRTRTERLLRQVNLTLTALPPRAILIVRHFPDPTPGQLLAQNGDEALNAWGKAAREEMHNCWRKAARPAHETISGHVNAVWFADQAEWLACLSWDVVNRTAHQRWWWQMWCGQSLIHDIGDHLFSLWFEDIRCLPQSIALLYKRHGMAITPLFHSLTMSHLDNIQNTLLAVYDLGREQGSPRHVEALIKHFSHPHRTFVEMLPSQQKALVTLALTISDYPTLFSRFQQDNLVLDFEPQTRARLRSTNSAPRRQPRTASVQIEVAETGIKSESNPSPHGPLQPQQHLEKRFPFESTSFARIPTKQSQDQTGFRSAHSRQPSQEIPVTVPKSKRPIENEAGSISASPKEAERGQSRDLFSIDQGITTHIGGIWYLINLFMALDWLNLPNGFELNGYHKLSILAKALLPTDLPHDITWQLLAEFARDDPPPYQVSAWVKSALPIVNSFIEQRLDQPHLFTEALQESATLYITRTHIDVHFSLAQISLPLRLAGLDRNPGWVPALGRVITLHFE